MSNNLGQDYDETSVEEAWKISNEVDVISMGVIYRVKIPIYCERLHDAEKIARQPGNNNFDSLIKRYLVAI